jgi:hypothetical protein
MQKMCLPLLTLLATLITQSVNATPASTQPVASTPATTVTASSLMHFGDDQMLELAYTRVLSASATFVAAPTNVQAVPGNPANGHYIVISFTDNSDNESGFEIWNGNDASIGDPAASKEGTSPSPGTGGTVTWNWWMPQANSYMCVRVRAYNDDNPRSYSAWAPANNGWACTTSS